MFWTIVIFLAVLSVLVLAHEWGHYYTAKKIGAKVEEFGLGFPPRAWSWKGKDGMTWSLNWVPIGGFVKIKGESGEDRQDEDSFAQKSLFARFAVLVAGVVMNMVAAAVLLSLAIGIGVPTVTEGLNDSFARLSNEQIGVMQLIEGSAAAEAGLLPGDQIVSLNGQTFANAQEARDYLSAVASEGVVDVAYRRAGEEQTVAVVPTYLEEVDMIAAGMAIVDTATVRYPWYMVPVKGLETTAFYTQQILVAFYDILATLFSGEQPDVELSGPIGIAAITGDVIDLGFVHLLQFAAILSINLAILNILPFPALDGGRIAFVLLEGIRRKPVSPQVEAFVHNAGFLLLLLLIIVVTYQDILRLT